MCAVGSKLQLSGGDRPAVIIALLVTSSGLLLGIYSSSHHMCVLMSRMHSGSGSEVGEEPSAGCDICVRPSVLQELPGGECSLVLHICAGLCVRCPDKLQRMSKTVEFRLELSPG